MWFVVVFVVAPKVMDLPSLFALFVSHTVLQARLEFALAMGGRQVSAKCLSLLNSPSI